jgi:hypothetical protein
MKNVCGPLFVVCGSLFVMIITSGQLIWAKDEQKMIPVTTIIDGVQTAVNIITTVNDVISSPAVVNTLETAADAANQIETIVSQITTTTNSAIGTNQLVVNTISSAELAKWKYINQYFVTNLKVSNVELEINKFVSECSHYLSMSSAVFHTQFCANLLAGLKNLFSTSATLEKLLSQAEAALTATIPSTTLTASKPNHTTSLTAHTKSISLSVAVPVIIMGGVLVYEILKYIISKIELNPNACLVALTNFLTNWDQNKAQTPEILRDFFEQLKQELIANNGKFMTIDAILAQKIVGAIVSTSGVFSSMQVQS